MYQELIQHSEETLKKSLSTYNNLDQEIIHYLTKHKKRTLSLSFDLTNLSDTFERLKHWRSFFKATLLAYLNNNLEEQKKSLKEVWYKLFEAKGYEVLQLEKLYMHITAHLLNFSNLALFECEQLPNGLCSLFPKGNSNLPSTPFVDQHAELVTLWILYGKLKGDPKIIQQGYKAAKWQMINLDDSFMPLRGFLTNHAYLSYPETVAKQALLFYIASLAVEDAEMAFLAKKHFSFLLKNPPHQLKGMSVDTLMVWKLVDLLYKNNLTPQEPTLEKSFLQKEMPIVGLRNEKINIVCTLAGQNSSMGTYKYDDLEIVAFGPQIENLGEGEKFGFIEKSMNKESYIAKKTESGFVLKGVVGLPKYRTDHPKWKQWQYPESWLDTKITCDQTGLNLQIKPLNILNKTYFVFYVIADQCLIKGEKKILYHSLEQYHGKACRVSFLNKTKMITLNLQKPEVEMKIIPLEGGNSFWGANYLIAYDLKKDYNVFEWKVTSNIR